MASRDQQDAAEEEREDVGDDDLEINTPPDDAPDASDESAFLDLNEFATELDSVLQNHDEDDNPDDDEAAWSPCLALLLPVRHRRTELARRTRWQRSRATTTGLQNPPCVDLGMWMARRLGAGRHGLFLNGL